MSIHSFIGRTGGAVFSHLAWIRGSILATGCTCCMCKWFSQIHARSRRFSSGSPVYSCLKNWDVFGSIKTPLHPGGLGIAAVLKVDVTIKVPDRQSRLRGSTPRLRKTTWFWLFTKNGKGKSSYYSKSTYHGVDRTTDFNTSSICIFKSILLSVRI